ncbi:MAG: nitrite reductase large subunit, partial [Thermoleophilaceae bacterium]|nr:nitrite reductase large subunit [Thermoleophilaceae bacterium]
MSSVLVVGGGIAGQAVCEELRRRDPQRPITLVCAEDRLPYDRVALSHLLAGEADPLGLQLRPDDWYPDRCVDVRLGVRAERLDPDAGVCELSDGSTVRFDRAVLCTGSDPLLPPIDGIDLPGVHPFRGPADCDAIAAAAAGASRAAVIGGGLLGLEAARGV